MDNDQPILSPAQRAMRCRAVLIALALLGTGASSLSELAAVDLVRWSSPHGSALNSGPQEISLAANRVVTSSTTKDSNPATASVTVLVTTNLPDTAVKPTGSHATPGKMQTADN